MDAVILVVTLLIVGVLISRRRHHDEIEEMSGLKQATIESGSRDPKTHFALAQQTWWLQNRHYPKLWVIAAATIVIGYFLISKKLGI